MSAFHRNPVGWFEIPVLDLDRAIAFYSSVFGYTLEKHELGPLSMAWFPMDDKLGGAPGSLVLHEAYTPSTKGVLVYFTAQSGDLDNELGRVEEAGGTVLHEKKQIGEHGYMAVIADTEGNRIAVHSLK